MPANKQTDQRRRQTGVAVLFAMTSLIVIALSSYVVWYQMGQIALGLHGWIALIAGSIGKDFGIVVSAFSCKSDDFPSLVEK